MPAGRPTKLTPEVEEEIIKGIRDCIPPPTAAELAGVSKRTYERWMKRGREAKRKSKFTEFCRKVEAAKSFAAKELLHKIMRSKDWKAQKYLLTLFDNTYNDPDKQRIELEHKGQVNSKVTLDVHDRIREYERQLQRESTTPDGDDTG